MNDGSGETHSIYNINIKKWEGNHDKSWYRVKKNTTYQIYQRK